MLSSGSIGREEGEQGRGGRERGLRHLGFHCWVQVNNCLSSNVPPSGTYVLFACTLMVLLVPRCQGHAGAMTDCSWVMCRGPQSARTPPLLSNSYVFLVPFLCFAAGACHQLVCPASLSESTHCPPPISLCCSSDSQLGRVASWSALYRCLSHYTLSTPQYPCTAPPLTRSWGA